MEIRTLHREFSPQWRPRTAGVETVRLGSLGIFPPVVEAYVDEEKTSNVAFLSRPDPAELALLEAEACFFANHFGKNPYSDFIFVHGARPSPAVAAAIGRLMGKRVRASDGSLQPAKSKAQRGAERKKRQIENSERDIDSNLNRALDAIALLAQNQADPIPLIHRLSTIEQVEITDNVEKAVEWLIRFADQWRSYVHNGIVQAQSAASRENGEARPRRLYLVSEGDRGG